MDALAGHAAFQTYALCSAILVIKLIAVAFYTSTQRFRVRGFVNEEDARSFGEGAVAAPTEKPEVAHALRMHRNDLENIPAFWAIGLLYVLSGASATGAAVFCWGFTLARVAHSVAYARHMQPARAILFGIGVLSLVCMSLNVIWKNL
jgi:uncharacterized membrane protein YecN with MAPEG domain